MFESNKLPYYACGLGLMTIGIILVITYGFIYLVMFLSNSLSEIEDVKKKLIIGASFIAVGFFIFGLTCALDYNGALS
jgi:predicted histidine transporter YuiF (NhaC family)